MKVCIVTLQCLRMLSRVCGSLCTSCHHVANALGSAFFECKLVLHGQASVFPAHCLFNTKKSLKSHDHAATPFSTFTPFLFFSSMSSESTY